MISLSKDQLAVLRYLHETDKGSYRYGWPIKIGTVALGQKGKEASSTAFRVLKSLMKEGLVQRLCHGLYYPVDLTLENAPLGTVAPSVTGGYWVRTIHGWKWRTGSTFPRPGGNWNRELILPEEVKQ